jgi:hypothetical protein
MRGAPGPSLPPDHLCAGNGLGPAAQTGWVPPGNFPWVGALCGRGSSCLGLDPDPRLLLLHIKPLPALHALLFHSLPPAPSPSP